MITVAERLAACSAGMVSVLYTLAALVTWGRVLSRGRLVERILVDRAFAWTAFAILFGLIAFAKLRWLVWDDAGMNLALIVLNAVVFVAGLFSVRAITASNGHSGAVLIFSAASLVAAVAIWLWG